MSGKLVVIYPNGTKEEESYEGDEPSLETLQGHVGGYIESYPGMVTYEGRLCVAYINEEGLLNDLPYNPHASKLARIGQGPGIVGNMVIIVPEMK